MDNIAAFIESDMDTDSASEPSDGTDGNRNIDHDEVNFIRIPWEGSPPKIIIAKSQQNVIKSPFEEHDDMQSVRKIPFCRDVNDRKGRTLKVWDLPLTWNNENISHVFAIFGEVQSVTIQNHNNIIDRHCLIRFKHSSKVDFAMNYDSSSIIQPLLKGSVKLGIDKYLIDYIKTRPLNVNQLQYEVNKFMASFDKIQNDKKEKKRLKPRRHRGWIQRRDKDNPGFTKIHYPNRWERRKHKAYRITDGEENIVNKPPEAQVYDKEKKENYYKHNRINDIYKNRQRKLFMKQDKAKRKIKQQMSRENTHQMRERLSIAGSRLQQAMQQKQRWDNDMTQTTNFRKNRNFKPS